MESQDKLGNIRMCDKGLFIRDGLCDIKSASNITPLHIKGNKKAAQEATFDRSILSSILVCPSGHGSDREDAGSPPVLRSIVSTMLRTIPARYRSGSSTNFHRGRSGCFCVLVCFPGAFDSLHRNRLHPAGFFLPCRGARAIR